jgi:hypothetical protein
MGNKIDIICIESHWSYGSIGSIDRRFDLTTSMTRRNPNAKDRHYHENHDTTHHENSLLHPSILPPQHDDDQGTNLQQCDPTVLQTVADHRFVIRTLKEDQCIGQSMGQILSPALKTLVLVRADVPHLPHMRSQPAISFFSQFVSALRGRAQRYEGMIDIRGRFWKPAFLWKGLIFVLFLDLLLSGLVTLLSRYFKGVSSLSERQPASVA